jgi:hypothetical protein
VSPPGVRVLVSFNVAIYDWVLNHQLQGCETPKTYITATGTISLDFFVSHSSPTVPRSICTCLSPIYRLSDLLVSGFPSLVLRIEHVQFHYHHQQPNFSYRLIDIPFLRVIYCLSLALFRHTLAHHEILSFLLPSCHDIITTSPGLAHIPSTLHST